MSDDIVRRLRDEARRPAMREVCSEAADTIARLYAAGDALEHSLLMWQSKHPHLDLGYDALAAWQEARHG